MFSLRAKGSFSKTERYLVDRLKIDIRKVLQENGQLGVEALQNATPVDSGLVASSWTFKVTGSKTSCTLSWHNTDVENGFPVAIMLQYGYATGTGGYVQGRDYINPAMRPVFDLINERVRKAVNRR